MVNEGEVCIANIGPKARQFRLMTGVAQAGFGLVVLLVLLYFGVPWYWRLPLFFVFWSSALGFFQWRDKT